MAKQITINTCTDCFHWIGEKEYDGFLTMTKYRCRKNNKPIMAFPILPCDCPLPDATDQRKKDFEAGFAIGFLYYNIDDTTATDEFNKYINSEK